VALFDSFIAQLTLNLELSPAENNSIKNEIQLQLN
jgi:hypothetical protein